MHAINASYNLDASVGAAEAVERGVNFIYWPSGADESGPSREFTAGANRRAGAVYSYSFSTVIDGHAERFPSYILI